MLFLHINIAYIKIYENSGGEGMVNRHFPTILVFI